MPTSPARHRPHHAVPVAALLAISTGLSRSVAGAQPLGSVRGTAVDSLRGRALAGAAVFIDGTTRSTVTDSAGRFVLDSVPAGRQVVSATHAALDGVGLDGIAAAVTVPAGGTAEAVVATPSRQTLWRRLCGAAAPADSVGALFGEVRDARTGAYVAGARATATWLAVGRGGRRLAVGQGAATTVSDSVGTFRLCGVPLGAELSVVVAAGPLDSARAQLALADQPYARVDLWVRGADTSASRAVGAAPAAPAGTAVLVGVVRDTLGAPRQGAVVSVDGVGGTEAVTDADGRFRLARLPAGTRPVVVRAIGYAPQVVNVTLRPEREAEVAVTLARAVRLAEVTVRARAAAHRAFIDELYQRQRLGLTRLLDTTLLRRTGQLRAALSDVPFARVQGTLLNWRVVFTAPNGGLCTANVFVDGQLVSWEVAQSLAPDEIATAEIYRRLGTLPARYAALVPGNCGSVLLWTRLAR